MRFNSIISEVPAHLGSSGPQCWPYSPEDCWEETEDFALVMLRDAACELGGGSKPNVGFTCVTTDPAMVPRDEILLYGKDLKALKENAAYARIALVQVGDIESDDADDTEQAYRAIQNIDFVKYHVFPRGFMMRTSSQSQREQVRVSREAVKSGISFRTVGNSFIRRYKQDPNVLAVKLIFVTDPAADF